MSQLIFTRMYIASLDFARQTDREDPLKKYRKQFYFPRVNDKPAVYLCGNSLGLQPKTTEVYIRQELEDWQNLGVEGHFHGRRPWFHYHKFFSEKEARLVGAKPSEVVVMNALTTNLHLMMVSFYRPTAKRYKIITEGGAFPSDQYALESQVKFHARHGGNALFDYREAIIELFPREGEDTLRTEDILRKIEETGDELALVMMGGVNYYTGQFFELEKITEKGHEAGAVVGFDLAHAAGNIPMKLHDWNVDFAVWCTYKYLNSGPGGTSGVFVHQRHENNPDLPRFAGWWGHKEEERFLMKPGYIPETGAAGWQLSNAQVLPMAAHLASLDILDEAGMDALREKSVKLTGYLEFLIRELNRKTGNVIRIITPSEPAHRGCQLSLVFRENGKKIFDELTRQGVIADWREPNVIRVAPVPLYNSFEDVFEFVRIVKKVLENA